MPLGIDPNPHIEEDLGRLEAGIRKLKVEYQMFFAGGLKREPVQLRWQVEKLVKRYGETRIQKYHHRFLFNTLQARYNLYTELWSKTLRAMEEGRRPGRRPAQAAGEDNILAACRVATERPNTELMRGLYDEFIKVRRRRGQKAKLSFDRFVQGISSQAGRLHESAGCDEMELRLVVRDQKVQIEARPCR